MDWEQEYWKLFQKYDMLWRYVAGSALDQHGAYQSPQEIRRKIKPEPEKNP